MIVSKYHTPVTHKIEGMDPRPNPTYRTRWIHQAQRAIAKSKRGGYPDRRERRLIARFNSWQAAQRQQQSQFTPNQEKAAA